MNKTDFKKNLPYLVLLVVVVGATVFGGYKLLKSPKSNNPQVAGTSNANPNGSNGTRRFGGSGNRGNFKPLHGNITSLNGQTIVMKADDGSSKNIQTTSSTRITTQQNGQMSTLAISDLKAGEEINVMSSDTTASDITARMIIIGTFTRPSPGTGGGFGSDNNNNPGGNDNSSSNNPI